MCRRAHADGEVAVVVVEPALVVLSHLRWTDVWQRPQQIVSRLAADRPAWFVEAPLRAGTPGPRLRQERAGAVHRVWLELPGEPGEVPPEEPPPCRTGGSSWSAR